MFIRQCKHAAKSRYFFISAAAQFRRNCSRLRIAQFFYSVHASTSFNIGKNAGVQMLIGRVDNLRMPNPCADVKTAILICFRFQAPRVLINTPDDCVLLFASAARC